MSVSIRKVNGNEDVTTVAALADEIWRQHFTPIIGAAQVDYMLENVQSVPAIASQIDDGASYYIAEVDGKPAGYLCLIPDERSRKVMISKIYIKQQARQTGIGSHLLSFVEQICAQRDFRSIWLTVNRFNDASIEWYRRKGFAVTDQVKKDIGGGFFMDDFIMTKPLS